MNNYSQPDVRLLIQHLASNLNQLRPRFARAERARAMSTARDLVSAEPNAENLQLLGHAYLLNGQFENAISSLTSSLAIESTSQPWRLLGLAYHAFGRRQAATAAFLRAIEIGPAEASSYYLLSLAASGLENDKFRERISTILSDQLAPTDVIFCRIALARIHQQAGEYDRAWENYELANTLKPSGSQAYRLAWEQAYRDVLDANRVEQLSASACQSTRPVFCVGMPRSGTTLVEQILASHPAIHGAGELHDIAFHANALALASNHPVEALAKLTADDVSQIAFEYIETIDAEVRQAAHAGSLYVIDKMPTNFAHLGLIACMLPNARVIHCIRDPLDTCVSCLTNNLDWPFCEQRALGEYYCGYVQTMKLWRDRLKLKIMEVHYEQLVTEPEQEVRKLLDFLELPWNEACLRSHENQRPVVTPSATQVRRPIYQTAIGSWRRYARHLEPLVSALDDIGITLQWRSAI